jgi:hypothetical protein
MKERESASIRIQVRFTPTMHDAMKESAARKGKPMNTEIKDLIQHALDLEECLLFLEGRGYPPIDVQWHEINEIASALAVVVETDFDSDADLVSWRELSEKTKRKKLTDNGFELKKTAIKLLDDMTENDLKFIVGIMDRFSVNNK